MLIPFSTDAPIYYWPFATVGLIVVNVLVYAVFMVNGGDVVDPWMLEHGHGLHPTQWLTSNFIHGSLSHLIGNMIFLWGFGLVVEGKLGWLKFLAVYLGIGILQCGGEQALTLGLEEGGSFGASAIIYGLLAISVIWAPRNEMNCLLILFFRPMVVEISILGFALLYIGIEFALSWLQGFAMSSSLLHLSGVMLGFITGIALLKLDWVDCEGWDLLAVWAGHEGESAQQERIKKTQRNTSVAEQSTRQEFSRAQFQHALAEGHAAAAAIYQSRSTGKSPMKLSRAELLKVIQILLRQENWSDSLPPMVDFLRQFPDDSQRVRLQLAQVLINQLKRPGQGLSVLDKLPVEELPPKLEKVRRHLVRRAQRMQQDGDFELAIEDW